LVADPARIQQRLNWRPRYATIREVVETAWRWHTTNPDGYGSRPRITRGRAEAQAP
jgi:UDP-glucose 4-epimerase